MTLGGARRGFVNQLPYDREVKRLISSGTQYIDTQLVITMPCDFRVGGKINLGAANLDCLVGMSNTSGGQGWCFPMANSSVYQLWNTSVTVNTGISIGTYCDFKLTMEPYAANPDYWLSSTYVDGVKKASGYTPKTFICNYSLYVFARNYNDSARSLASGELQYLKIEDSVSGNSLRDYIPVIKNNEGVLYDRVSGSIHGNLGTGKFGWVELDGSIVQPV